MDASARSPPTSRTAASRSPARPTPRWSSTRSTAAPRCSWPTSRTRPRRPGTSWSRARSICANRWPAASTSPIPPPASIIALGDNPAVLMVRPRGCTSTSGTSPSRASRSPAPCSISASIFCTMPRAALDAGSGPYFYLPKLESRHEAALWSDVFAIAEERLGLDARDDQGDRADRDPPRRVRDGRDPPRAAREYRRPQLRPLGLYLLVHQAARPLARPADARPLGDDHG